MRNILIMLLFMFGLVPVSSRAFVTDTDNPIETVGPEVAQIPLWSVATVIPGDEFQKTMCVPFLRDKQILGMTVVDCTRDIAIVNNLSLFQLDHINPGERYWVPADSNTIAEISEQRQERFTLLKVAKNPLDIILGVEKLRGEVGDLNNSVTKLQSEILTPGDVARVAEQTFDIKFAGLPRVSGVSLQELSVIIDGAIADALKKAAIPVTMNTINLDQLADRVKKNEEALTALNLKVTEQSQLADKNNQNINSRLAQNEADISKLKDQSAKNGAPVENKNPEIFTRLTAGETKLTDLENKLAEIAKKSVISTADKSPVVSAVDDNAGGWWKWVLVAGLILTLLYLFFSKTSRPVVLGIVQKEVSAVKSQVATVLSDLENVQAQISMIKAYYDEETGFIVNLPSQVDLDNLSIGSEIKINFNSGKNELNFRVENDHRTMGSRGLRVLDWPKDWTQQKRSLISVRRSSIVAVVKDYNAKKDVPAKLVRQAG